VYQEQPGTLNPTQLHPILHFGFARHTCCANNYYTSDEPGSCIDPQKMKENEVERPLPDGGRANGD
jgi:hypothetical protein